MTFRYYYMIALFVCLCLPGKVSGQYMKKESIDGQNRVVFYAEGMVETAIWPMGMNLTRNDATIRHQVLHGNKGNISVNDRVSARFIVAPTHCDVGNTNWALAAGGAVANNSNLEANFTGAATALGCNKYSDGSSRKWRVPTQRELQLIWLFRDAIAAVYPEVPMMEDIYWSATEESANQAWVFDFSTIALPILGSKFPAPRSFPEDKTVTHYVRCVSDY